MEHKRILLPTDGSLLSKEAVAAGIAYARRVGAAVVGIHVIPEPHPDLLEAWLRHDPDYAGRRQHLHEKFADEYLGYVADAARAAGVPCTCRTARDADPAAAIVREAERQPCDLIFMASHGWRNGEATFPGSETLKVLQRSGIPVLVFKSGAPSRHGPAGR